MSFNRHDHHQRIVQVPKAKIVVGLVDFPANSYEKGKADAKRKIRGCAHRSSFPIHIYRVFKQAGEDGKPQTHGDVIGDGRLPDLRSTAPKSLEDFRHLIAKLLYLTSCGIPQDWCPHRHSEVIKRSYKLTIPVWWPNNLEFKDPRKLRGATARRGIREAVVRCYHLFNQLDMLDVALRKLADQVLPKVAPGELPLSTKMMMSLYAIYMHGSPHGIDE